MNSISFLSPLNENKLFFFSDKNRTSDKLDEVKVICASHIKNSNKVAELFWAAGYYLVSSLRNREHPIDFNISNAKFACAKGYTMT